MKNLKEVNYEVVHPVVAIFMIKGCDTFLLDVDYAHCFEQLTNS